MAEVVIGRMSDEAYWTVDVTDGTQVSKWKRLTEEAGGEIIPKSDAWTRFRIPVDKLRFGLKRTRNLTYEQREVLRQRFQKRVFQNSSQQDTEEEDENISEMSVDKQEAYNDAFE